MFNWRDNAFQDAILEHNSLQYNLATQKCKGRKVPITMETCGHPQAKNNMNRKKQSL